MTADAFYNLFAYPSSAFVLYIIISNGKHFYTRKEPRQSLHNAFLLNPSAPNLLLPPSHRNRHLLCLLLSTFAQLVFPLARSSTCYNLHRTTPQKLAFKFRRMEDSRKWAKAIAYVISTTSRKFSRLAYVKRRASELLNVIKEQDEKIFLRLR